FPTCRGPCCSRPVSLSPQGQRAMVLRLARNWWALGLRGSWALFLGVMLFLVPGRTLDLQVLVFGLYLLADGVCTAAAAVGHGQGAYWWPLLVQGIGEVALAAVFLFSPGLTAPSLHG